MIFSFFTLWIYTQEWSDIETILTVDNRIDGNMPISVSPCNRCHWFCCLADYSWVWELDDPGSVYPKLRGLDKAGRYLL